MDLTQAHRSAIDNTMEAVASARNNVLDVGRAAGPTSKRARRPSGPDVQAGPTSNVKIPDRCYYDLRKDHGLPANLAVRAIARAAGILKVKERRDSNVKKSRQRPGLKSPPEVGSDRPRT